MKKLVVTALSFVLFTLLVTLLSAAMGESRATPRGAALVLDLHMSLTLRNSTANRIHGVALRVVSQEVTVGGKAATWAVLEDGDEIVIGASRLRFRMGDGGASA